MAPNDDLPTKFKKVVWLVRYAEPHPSYKSPSVSQKLLFYKYFKQATMGDCPGECPSVIKFEANQKWKAWDEVRGMDQEEAMWNYVNEFAKEAIKTGGDDWLERIEAAGVMDNYDPNGDWVDWEE